MRVNLNQMCVFYLAARHKSMVAAAKILYVSPPAVTMQVKKMETWLGFSVFERGLGELRLTPRGKALYDIVAPMFDGLEELERNIHDLVQEEGGELRLGAHHLPANYFIPDMLAKVREKYPALKVSLELGTQDRLLEKLFQQQLDLVIIVGNPSPDAKCRLVHLFDEEWPLVTAAGHNLGKLDYVSAQDLGSIPLILQQKGTGARQAVLGFLRRHNVQPNITFDNLSSDVIKPFLQKMEAVAFIGRSIAQKALNEGLLHEINIVEGPLVCHFQLAYMDNQYIPVKISQFLAGITGFTPKIPGA